MKYSKPWIDWHKPGYAGSQMQARMLMSQLVYHYWGYGAHADSGSMVLLRLDRDNPHGTGGSTEAYDGRLTDCRSIALPVIEPWY